MHLLKKIALSIIALAVSGTFIQAANAVVVKGVAPQYAGDSLHFLSYADYLTLAEEQLATVKVAADGSFSASFALTETRMLFLHLGKNKTWFYAEPGKQYEVVLPPRLDKMPADSLNPYFEENEIQLGIQNIKDTDLNFLIQAFDNSFEPYMSTFAHNIYAKKKPDELSKALQSLDNSFPNRNNNQFFEAYFRYKTGLLRHWAYQFKAKAVSDGYFKQQPVLYQNPAYMELFGIVFDKYFSYFGRTPKGAAIYDAINKERSLQSLHRVLTQDSVLLDKPLRELVMLKCLYDEFYQPNFTRKSILVILDSIAQTSQYPENKNIAQRMENKITRLMLNYAPPKFSLSDTSGKKYTLESWHGKYVYLSFCASASYACLKEFAMLQNLKERCGDKLEFVTILADDSERAREFLRVNNYKWTFLSYVSQPLVLKEYDIRAFPTYFLISPEGKLLRSPAKSPAEDFEKDWAEIQRDAVRSHPR
jgi:peroxiredoxin